MGASERRVDAAMGADGCPGCAEVTHRLIIIQVSYDKFPLLARWEKRVCKGRSPLSDFSDLYCIPWDFFL